MKNFILIEPSEQRVSVVEGLSAKSANLEKLKALIGCDYISSFISPYKLGGESVFFTCDDEGLLKDPEFFTYFPHWDSPVAGNLILSDVDDDGFMVPFECDPSEIKARTLFYQKVYDPKIGKNRLVPLN